MPRWEHAMSAHRETFRIKDGCQWTGNLWRVILREALTVESK